MRDVHEQAIAVALAYDGATVPRVTAKGRDQVAEAILDLAREHGVPLHENGTLAGILAHLPVGEAIPETLYRAVAEVIAWAWFVAGRVPEH